MSVDADLHDRLSNKTSFYELCAQYDLPHPLTFVLDKAGAAAGKHHDLPFGFPVAVKPANSVEYLHVDFPGRKKAFILHTPEELAHVVSAIYGAGYGSELIIQDFIPGDDSYMRVLTNYSDRNGKVKFMCLGHVLLEEHTPHGSGNHAVILNEPCGPFAEKIRAFLEDIGYVGFSNFDIKYDQRDGKYKFFEINCRQGRSNYYVTGAGYNIAKLLVEDQVEKKDLPFVLADRPSLWRVVPRKVAFTYIVSDYHQQMRELMRQGKEVRPLFYDKDKALMRTLRMEKNLLGHFQKFKTYYERKA